MNLSREVLADVDHAPEHFACVQYIEHMFGSQWQLYFINIWQLYKALSEMDQMCPPPLGSFVEEYLDWRDEAYVGKFVTLFPKFLRNVSSL